MTDSDEIENEWGWGGKGAKNVNRKNIKQE